jgi:hypothetical protein
MWDLWWRNWHWNRLFSEFFGFPVSIIPLLLHIHSRIIREMDNGPFSGCSSTESYSHSIVTTIIKGTIFSSMNILWETLMGNILFNDWLVASF